MNYITPIEKAEELVNKYKNYVHGYVGSSMLTNYEYPDQILSQAKKCATICVDEIILNYVTYGLQTGIYYWEEVREEIKNYEDNV